MPTYQYACASCRHEFEEFQSITAKPLRKCPACGKSRLERLIGAGAGLIFKGSGFYQTDYRSESYRKAAEAESKTGKPEVDSKPPKTDGESKPAAETAPATPKPPAAESPRSPAGPRADRSTKRRKSPLP